NQGIFCGVNLMFPHDANADTAIDQQYSEDIQNPVETVNQPDAGANKNTSHDERAQNSPEQHPVLLLFGDGEIAEDEQENKQIVYAERELEYVSGEKLERHL